VISIPKSNMSFIARQHAMHAERDIVIWHFSLSVCLSVCLLSVCQMPVFMSKRTDMSSDIFDDLVGTLF